MELVFLLVIVVVGLALAVAVLLRIEVSGCYALMVRRLVRRYHGRGERIYACGFHMALFAQRAYNLSDSLKSCARDRDRPFLAPTTPRPGIGHRSVRSS